MSLYSLQYADDPGPSTQTSYSLIELPPAFAKAANERDLSNGVLASLTIKGQPSDEAVLCTQNTTYNIRSVQNSNSLLLCQASTSSSTSGSNKGKKVEVQTTLHQTLELEPTIPKLEKISDLLRGQEWIPEDDVEEERQPKRRKTRRYTFEDVIDLVPASDAQIENALKGKRVLIIDGYCRPISLTTLSALLRNALNTLTMLSITPDWVTLIDLADSLQKDDNIPREVTIQLFEWFGHNLGQGKWKLDMPSIVKEIGKEVLSRSENKAIPQSQFIDAWKERVGEQFSNLCDLELLDGLYILTPGKGPQATTIMYFCASELSLDPASRFSELFSVKPKWRMDEVAPFLLDLAVDDKKRDALTLKFTRKFKGDDGHVYYTARGK